MNRIPATAGDSSSAGSTRTAKTITIVRDAAWWGDEAKLDKIIYRASEQDSLTRGVQQRRARRHRRRHVRAGLRARQDHGGSRRSAQADGHDFRHITFNGSSETAQVTATSAGTHHSSASTSQAIAQSDLQGAGLADRADSTTHSS
ncbi:hypothetical protein [Nonomuraea rubra]|uniref:hypothetical protein n=1 Tax=Nonomuraea rubra TaxID=46180 RepID=UPI0031E969D6